MKKRTFAAIALAVCFVLAVFAGCTDDKTDGEKALSVGLKVECISLVQTPDAVAEAYKTLVPDDGYIIKRETFGADEGENLYGFLLRIAKDRGIAVVSSDGFTGGKYVSAIANISDTATTSGYWGGWTFTVNGETPKDGETWLSIDQVTLKDGDEVLFSYTIGAAGEY